MILKIINSALILVALFLGLKQGGAMLSGKPEMLGEKDLPPAIQPQNNVIL